MAVLSPKNVYAPGRKPPKAEIIQLLEQIIAGNAYQIAKATRAQLYAVTPTTGLAPAGSVLDDPNPAYNGIYAWSGSAWTRERGFPVQLSKLTVTGGTANAVQASSGGGVDLAEVIAYFIEPTSSNSGAMTLAIDGGAPKPVKNVNGASMTVGQWPAGRKILLTDDGAEYTLISDPDIDGMLATVIDLVNDATGLGTPGDGTVTPEKLAAARLADFKAMLGITTSTAIGRALNGLLIANNSSTPNTRLDIGPGSCRDKDQSVDMVVAAGWSKSTAAWAAGNGNFGMLDTGTIAANKGYHLFLIFNPTSGLYDYLCSLSPTAPVMPSGFTKRRRIGAFVTGASAVIKPGLWYSSGEFRFAKAFSAVSGIPGNLVTLSALPIPLGVKLKVKGQVFGDSSGNGGVAFWMIIRDPDVGAIADVSDQWYEAVGYKNAGANDGVSFDVWTDTSGQVYHVPYPRVSTHLMYIYLQGWTDLREEFA